MTVAVEIPDTVAQAFAPSGDLSRRVLEALAIKGYRTDRLSEYEVQQLELPDGRLGARYRRIGPDRHSAGV